MRESATHGDDAPDEDCSAEEDGWRDLGDEESNEELGGDVTGECAHDEVVVSETGELEVLGHAADASVGDVRAIKNVEDK